MSPIGSTNRDIHMLVLMIIVIHCTLESNHLCARLLTTFDFVQKRPISPGRRISAIRTLPYAPYLDGGLRKGKGVYLSTAKIGRR